MSEGWIRLHRALLDKAIWNESSGSRIKVMFAILLLANWKENRWVWKGKKYKCKAGEFITSVSKLASVADASRNTVKTALVAFDKTYDFLRYETSRKSTRITVLNWKRYQLDSDQLERIEQPIENRLSNRLSNRLTTI